MTPTPDGGAALGPGEIPLSLSLRCPGDPGCPDTGDGKLLVGYAAREITPQVEPFTDLDGNHTWDFGEPYVDLNGNGKFDRYTMFNTGETILGVHDPIWVRCYVVRRNETTLAHCAYDAGGYMYNEVKQIRADLPASLGVDLFITSATHSHSAPDTVGIFGISDSVSGYVPAWMAQIRALSVEAVSEAVSKLQPAKMSIASLPVEEGANHDMSRTIDDTRDPVIIDDVMHVMQFDTEAGKPICTVVNWTAHPDANKRSNRYIGSEFPLWLRSRLEEHTGSPLVYISGSVGGQIGPGRVRAIAEDGTELPCNARGDTFIEAWGTYIARFAIRAWDARTPVTSPTLALRTTRINVHIDNIAYHTAFNLGLIPRTLFGYDKTKPLINDPSDPTIGDNAPLIDTELAYITLGPASIQTIPGELLPEFFIGGYDGSYTGGWTPFVHKGPIVDWCDPTHQTGEGDYPEPPDVSLAPQGPYLKDLMTDGPPEHRMIFGLTMDMLGYIVPAYNFYLDPLAPYLNEPPGDSHYEETNSIGPRAEAEIVGTARQLVQAR